MIKKTVIATVLIVAAIGFFLNLPQPVVAAPKDKLTIISQADVFDGQTWSTHTDVVFKDGLIIAVGQDLLSQYPAATIVKGAGKFLIPGLIDAHTHAWDNALKQAVRFGVTTELDMFTNNAFAISQRKLRHQHQADNQQADLFSAGTLVTSPKGHGTEYGFKIATIDDPAQANEFVAARVNEGSDYIKIVYNATQRFMPSLDKATLAAVIKASHQQGKLAVVHISDYQSAVDAIDAGADGLVHGFMDTVAIDELATRMAKNNQFVIPTLSILASMTGQQTTATLIESFNRQAKFKVADIAPQLTNIRGKKDQRHAFKQAQSNVYTLAKAGVLILAGTDAPNPGTAHGISLHGELALLVASGLTPTQALKAATSNVARAFKLPQRGYIKPLMKADFVLLNKNPAQDISHTRAIEAVYKNGFVIQYSDSKQAPKIATATSLGDFTQDRSSSLTTSWQASTDQLFGGDSIVTLEIVRQQLVISGNVGRVFSFPWAGAYLSFSDSDKVAFDISAMDNLSFNAKGTPGDYKVMIFSTKQPMRPIEVEFSVTSEWQDQRISLGHIPSALLQSVHSIAIVAAKPMHKFELVIDDIGLYP